MLSTKWQTDTLRDWLLKIVRHLPAKEPETSLRRKTVLKESDSGHLVATNTTPNEW